MKPFCINPECENFLPEDKRGYRRKASSTGAATAGAMRRRQPRPSRRF